MTDEFKNALELIKQLDAEFPNTQSLIVGGAVRDFLLHIPAHDVDIATNVPFEQLAKKFVLNDITKNTVNAQPVSIISFNGFNFEIAAFRADSFGVEGRANNAATIVNSFGEDSARRDITINAMGIDSSFNIVDPQFGRSDLINRKIRAVGIPAMRFREDATRILRVFRFAAKLRFDIDEDTFSTARQNKLRLMDRNQISPESIAKEFYKAASSGPQLAWFLELLNQAEILELLLPEFMALNGLTHDPQHHPEGRSTVIGHIMECLVQSESHDPVVNLGILFHDLGKAVTRETKENGFSSYKGHEGAGVPIVEGIFERLRFNDLTAEDKDAILFAVSSHMLIHNIRELSTKTLVKLVHNQGWNVLKAVALADEASRGKPLFSRAAFDKKIADAEEKVSRIAVSNDDLRLKVKAFVDGNKVQEWFPEVRKNIRVLTPILSHCADFILEKLDQGYSPTENDIKRVIQEIITFELYE